MSILLACDLDGTLLDEKHQVDEKSLNRMKEFCEQGHALIIATGRLDHDIQYIEDQLGFFGMYRISQNGACVKNSDGKLLYQRVIEKQAVQKISDFFAQKKLRVEASTINNRYFPTPRPPEEVAEYYDSSIILSRFYEDIPKLDISNFLIFGQREDFEEIREFIAIELADAVDGFMSSPSTFEIAAKGASKGTALMSLVAMMGEEKNFDMLAAIGDSENDVSMFPVVEDSFAVAHARIDIQEQAKHTVKTVGDAINFLLEKRAK